jgi:hypothetical protein
VAQKTPSPAEIVTALRETGFVFEQEVATELEKLGFHVETNWPFRDNQEGKSREIDVRAVYRVHFDEVQKFSFFVELLVECKDTNTPWAFVSRKKNRRELEQPEAREYIFPRTHFSVDVSPNSYREIPTFAHLGLAQHHYYYRESYKSNQFAKIVSNGKNGWTANRDGIHDGIVLPLAKLLDIRRNNVIQANNRGGWRNLTLFFPVVAINNSLFLYDPIADLHAVKSIKRASYVRQIDSEKLNGTYLIDFVAASHLKNYIESEVLEFAGKLFEMINKDQRVFG